jgi:hypothetical protein
MNEINEIFELADRLRDLREEKDVQTAILKDISIDIDNIEYALTEAMTIAECPSFTRGDKQFVMTTTTRWLAEKEQKEALYSALRENGYEHLFSVNAQTLGGFVRDMAEEYAAEHNGADGLPDWLVGLVKSYNDVGITIKTKNKNNSNQKGEIYHVKQRKHCACGTKRRFHRTFKY